jgi:phage tail-like protein
MVTALRNDPYGDFNFLVEIDGITRGAFQEVGGLDSSVDVMEYREGGDVTAMRKLPAMTKYSNITLKRGVTDDVELYEWHRQWVDGDPAAPRKNGSIVLLDRQGQEQARWDFVNAWPTRWTGPALNAEGTDVAVESLELAHEGIKRV